MEHLAIEKEQGTEGLVLCRSGNVFLDGQVGEKGFDLESAHFGRVTHIVEVDVALDPANVGLLRALGMVFEADGIMDLIQQLLRAVLFQGMTPPFDQRGFRVHDIVIVGPARQPDCPLALRQLSPKFGMSQPVRCAMPNPFGLGTRVDRPK